MNKLFAIFSLILFNLCLLTIWAPIYPGVMYKDEHGKGTINQVESVSYGKLILANNFCGGGGGGRGSRMNPLFTQFIAKYYFKIEYFPKSCI